MTKGRDYPTNREDQMDWLPVIDQRVTVSDPWGPQGTGTVLGVQRKPHHAVLVRLDSGRECWVLGPHVRPEARHD